MGQMLVFSACPIKTEATKYSTASKFLFSLLRVFCKEIILRFLSKVHNLKKEIWEMWTLSKHDLSRLAFLLDLVWHKSTGGRTLDLFFHNLSSLVQNHLRFCYQCVNEVKGSGKQLHHVMGIASCKCEYTHSSWLSLWGLSYPIQHWLVQTMGGG